jgi:4-aminobutyrate aminotransferase/(S)-3-amino-2-methylpropionate transaminase
MCAAMAEGAPSSSMPLGEEPPLVHVRPPGPVSRNLAARLAAVESPAFGARRRGRAELAASSDRDLGPIVYERGVGSNVVDVDGNRYVDCAAAFGALLVGHAHPKVDRALREQAGRLWVALGDLYAAESKVALLERLASLYPRPGARVLLGQSGADAVTAAIKTAKLATGKPGLVAFEGAYHGLGYGPLAACGFQASFREPFTQQLNPHVTFVSYPRSQGELEGCLESVRRALRNGDVGAVLVEPVLGRGGCWQPPPGLLRELVRLAEDAQALVIADEIWTGLGRSGRWLASTAPELEGAVPHLVCLGKGLGGGLPISACIGADEVMQAWQRPAGEEVVHTGTFHGAPLPCATALATLDVLAGERLIERAAEIGSRFRDELAHVVSKHAEGSSNGPSVRGSGLMIGIDWGSGSRGLRMGRRLLESGYLVTSGGSRAEVTILTPPLVIAESLLRGFVATLSELLDDEDS